VIARFFSSINVVLDCFLERKTHMKGGEAKEVLVEEGMGITKQLTGVGKNNS